MSSSSTEWMAQRQARAEYAKRQRAKFRLEERDWPSLPAHLTSKLTPKPRTTWHSSKTHLEPTSNPPYTAWESERLGTPWEPSRSMAEREKPTRSLREPARNPLETHSKPYLKQRRSPPPIHWCL